MSEFTKGPWEVQSKYFCSLTNYGLDTKRDVTVVGWKMGDIALVNNTYSDDEQAEAAHLIASSPRMYEVLEECRDSLIRYQTCLQGYAKESAHKGNRDNQSFWETRAKDTAELLNKANKVLSQARGEGEVGK